MLFTHAAYDRRSSARIVSKYTALFGWGLRIADIGVLLLAGMLAYWLRFGSFALPLDYGRAIARAMVFALVVFTVAPLYRSWRGRGLAREITTMVATYSVLFVLLALHAVALKYAGEISRAWLGLWFVGCLAGGTVMRTAVRGAASWTRQHGMDLRRAVIVGGGDNALRIVEAMRQRSWTGIKPVGWFHTGVDGTPPGELPHLGGLEQLAEYVEHAQISQVWIALPLGAQDTIAQILQQLAHSTVDIKFVPDMFGLQLLNHSIDQIAGLPVINLQESPLQGHRHVLKSFEDRFLSLLILIAISPVLLMIAIAIKASSPGPVFYQQERVSWNNKKFRMLKFRSMPVNAEAETGAVWAKAGEARATGFGQFLRRTSLDELPQFINVLKGEMSIVGPRPERPVFVDKFKHDIPAYMKKHMVKAGITGWAQVNGWRGSTDLAQRIECDLYYIEHWSLWLDVRILLMTLFVGFANKRAY